MKDKERLKWGMGRRGEREEQLEEEWIDAWGGNKENRKKEERKEESGWVRKREKKWKIRIWIKNWKEK